MHGMYSVHALSFYVRIIANLYCIVKFVSVIKASRLVTIEVENQSWTPNQLLTSLQLRHLCTHYIVRDLGGGLTKS